MTGDTYRIAVLVPSRGRPHNIERLYNVIQDTAANPASIFLAVRVDSDDPHLAGYRMLEKEMQSAPNIGFDEGPRTRLAASWNEMAAWAAFVSSGQLFTHLALWGDDVVPETHGWDQLLVATLQETGPGFAYGRDGIWDNQRHPQHPEHLVLPTAALVDVVTYRALGWIAPSVLTHLCIDMAWRDVGIEAGALQYVPEVMIRHLHRLVGAPNDDTYREANEGPQATADHRAYTRWRHSEDFDQAVVRLKAARARWALNYKKRMTGR